MDKRVKETAVRTTDLTLDQWRPIPNEEFARRLSEACFYDGERFTAPIVENIDLARGTAIVFLTCVGYDDKNKPKREPGLLILESPLIEGVDHEATCFTHN